MMWSRKNNAARPKFDWHPSPRRPRSPSSVTSSSSAFSSRLPSFSSNAGDSFVTAEDCFEEDELESSVSSNEAIAGGYCGRSALQFVVPTATRFAWWRRKPLYYLPNVPEEYRLETHSGVLRRFSLRELKVATDNFSRNNQLGSGGIVYKGQLADGSLVAVKRLKDPHIGTEPQFQKELISLKHKNLLILQGFCMTPTERFLVYPYMANRSLAHQLRERLPTEPPLDWPTRRQIALGSARGLSYLHDHCDPKIIHRDVKASNIFLDEEFEAVLGDFRLAELIDCKDTHVTTDFICGTFGYMAPEYISTRELSEKTDVFGYGIVLLELITGKRALDHAQLDNDDDDAFLLDWVKGLLEDERLHMLVDPELRYNYIEAEVEFAVQLAILCSQGSPMGRPKMSEVVRILEGEDLTERWKEWKKAEGWNERKAHECDLDLFEFGRIQRVDSTENLDSMELSCGLDLFEFGPIRRVDSTENLDSFEFGRIQRVDSTENLDSIELSCGLDLFEFGRIRRVDSTENLDSIELSSPR